MSQETTSPHLGPFEVELEQGKRYAWCACGRSSKGPFCDGSHKGTMIGPTVFTADATKTVSLCGCKASQGAPFCDGSHSDLSAASQPQD